MKIRLEKPEDYYQSELMTQRAFWNKHMPGCDEHYLVHMIRTHEDYLPELTRVAEEDGKVVGLIMYTKAWLKDAEEKEIFPILCFGPLCVDPDYQAKGIGGTLLKESIEAAKKEGYKGIVIFGEPDYYPRHGFLTCDHFGITTVDGKNFDAFMGYELVEGGLNHPGTRFYESEVFENLPKEEVEKYNEKFPYMEKLVLPGQWPQE